jgi:hypothetical protein
MALDINEVDALPLSKIRRKAIKDANAVKPIRLSPEMILQRDRGSRRRSPLGIRPSTIKKINYSVKLVTTTITALLLTMVVLEVVLDPTWIIFASCCLKLIAVIINGFAGFKFGYENIVIDTVNYTSDQIDLLDQAIEFLNKMKVQENEETANN